MNPAPDLGWTSDRSLLERYYRWHAPIYDLTRWTFLLGRSRLLRHLEDGPDPRHIVEVGCGTGRNLAELAWRFPHANLTGVDLSADMLARARRRLAGLGSRACWLNQEFEAAFPTMAPADLVVFSYSLSMMNPGWERALQLVGSLLEPKGRLAVVDFAGSRWSWFRRWMGCNHVRLDDHLLPAMTRLFEPVVREERLAFVGWWRYLVFVGQKPSR